MTDGKRIAEERWELPAKFLTPEMIAAADEEQKRLAALAGAPFGGVSPQEQQRARSAQMVEHLLNTLSAMEGQTGKFVDESRTAIKHQLAEHYSIIGRYDLAAEIEPDDAYAQEYARILQAVLRDDNEWCDCGDNHGTGAHAEITVPSVYAKAEIFSIKHNAPAYLIACQKCPMLNVSSEMPTVLHDLRAQRARAQQMVGHLSPQEAEATLKRAGHTTDRLLKKT